MKLKHICHTWRGVIPGLSIMVCAILGVNSVAVTKHFLAQPETLSVNDPRPVGAAMQMLERKYGVVITYEDPPYVHVTDIEDQTIPEWKLAHPNGPRALIPKGGSLEITYQTPPGPVKPDEIRSVIQKLLDAHAKKNNPGRFRVLQEGEMFHVIPIQARGSSGSLVTVNSILDMPISFPEQERPVMETLEIIANSVSKARGIKLITGTVPMNLLFRTSSRQGATNEKARDALISALKATNTKLSWRILYDPGIKWYALNVHWVR